MPSRCPSARAAAASTPRIPTAISVSVRCWRQLAQITSRHLHVAPSARRSKHAEIGEDDLFEVDLVHLPGRVVHVAVGAHEQRRLTLGVALADHVVHSRDRRRIGALRGEQAMASRRSRRSDADELHVRCDRITRWSHTRSRSATMCEERITVMPVSATTSITVWRNSRRARGSSEATGSSSSSSSGRFASASVSATCACWPPESLPTFCRSGSPSSLDARVRERVVPRRVELAAEGQRLCDREALVERMVLREEAHSRQHRPGLRAWQATEHDGSRRPTGC